MDETIKDAFNKVVQYNNYINSLSENFYNFLKSTFIQGTKFQPLNNENIFPQDVGTIKAFVVTGNYPCWKFKNDLLTITLDSFKIIENKLAYRHALKLFYENKDFEVTPDTYIYMTDIPYSAVSFDEDGNIIHDKVWDEIQRQFKEYHAKHDHKRRKRHKKKKMKKEKVKCVSLALQ